MTGPNDLRDVDDGAIEAMLAARADRLRPAPIDVAAIVAEAGDHRRQPGRLAVFLPRVGVSVAAALVAVVASALVLGPLVDGPVGSTVPSGRTAGTSATSSLSGGVQALDAETLGELVRTRSAQLAPRLAVVRATLTISAADPRCSGAACTTAAFEGAGDGIAVRVSADLVSEFEFAGSMTRAGSYLVRFTTEARAEMPLLDVLGLLLAGQPDGWTSTAATALAVDPRARPAYAAIDGWLVRTPPHSCPTIVGPSPQDGARRFGCPEDDYLTDRSYQPVGPRLTAVMPPSDALVQPAGTYEAFAPDPLRLEDGSYEPRRAIYVLHKDVLVCSVPGPCPLVASDRMWTILDRIEPIPPERPVSAPEPSAAATPTAVGGTWPGGIPRAVDGEPVLIELAAQHQAALATDATPYLVGGWFTPGAQLCSGGIGPRDPNPLGTRGCARYSVVGIPGIPYYPPDLPMPAVDTPVVFRAHVHDPGAETCWDVVACRERLVIDAVVWAGNDTTRATPIGPSEAMGIATGAAFADNRVQPDGSGAVVDEDLFAVAAACPAPWPTLTFRIRGDVRLIALAVFPNPAAREEVQATFDPSAARACFNDPQPRIGEPRWIARDNMLLLVSSDAATAAAIERNLSLTPGSPGWKPIPLPGREIDRSIETLDDFLAARAAGEIDHAAGSRLILPEIAGIERYASFQADTLRRRSAKALAGTISLVPDPPLRADLEKLLPGALPSGVELSVHHVDYPDATDAVLDGETYLVIHDPASTFADWLLLGIDGAPYPEIPIREPVVPPPGNVPSPDHLPGDDGSGDTPCLPAGEECG